MRYIESTTAFKEMTGVGIGEREMELRWTRIWYFSGPLAMMVWYDQSDVRNRGPPGKETRNISLVRVGVNLLCITKGCLTDEG